MDVYNNFSTFVIDDLPNYYVFVTRLDKWYNLWYKLIFKANMDFSFKCSLFCFCIYLNFYSICKYNLISKRKLCLETSYS